MNTIDNFLNKITVYRLLVYYLIMLLCVAFIYCIFGILPYNPFLFVLSTLIIVGVCWITNKIFAKVFQAPTNVESVYISALILALIISPIKSVHDLPLLLWASILTMASKYVLAINKKHIFNPVAIAIVLTAFGFNGTASWWVGTMAMVPFVLLGVLIVRKIRRYDLVFYFFAATLVTIIGFSITKGSSMFSSLYDSVFSSSLFFFAFVMLTEPLTTPPTKKLQMIYGVLVGILFAPQFHIGSFYTTPEISLVLGNIFAYIVSPKTKVITTLKEKIQISPAMFDFLFTPEKKLAFSPGQYMEWTLPHERTDRRGNRRYFTIASSPTEDTVRLGVKFYPNGSSYKKAMIAMNNTTPIVGTQIAGDFTLPNDPKIKLAFIAGGIGITPFRSMIKYLVDTKQRRDVVLYYANKAPNEIIYYDVFNQAQQELGIQTIYTLTDRTKIPANWQRGVGRIDQTMIQKETPDFKDRVFYISGTHAMVEATKKTLQNMGIAEKQIKIDFFSGFV